MTRMPELWPLLYLYLYLFNSSIEFYNNFAYHKKLQQQNIILPTDILNGMDDVFDGQLTRKKLSYQIKQR